MSHVKHPSHPVDAGTSNQIAARADLAVGRMRCAAPRAVAGRPEDVVGPGRPLLPDGSSRAAGRRPGSAGWNDGQSSAAHTVSGAATPADDGSCDVGRKMPAHRSGRSGSGPTNAATASPGTRAGRSRSTAGTGGRCGAAARPARPRPPRGRRGGHREVQVGRGGGGQQLVAVQELDRRPVAADLQLPPQRRRPAQPHAHRVPAHEGRQPAADRSAAVGGAGRADEALGDGQGGHPPSLGTRQGRLTACARWSSTPSVVRSRCGRCPRPSRRRAASSSAWRRAASAAATGTPGRATTPTSSCRTCPATSWPARSPPSGRACATGRSATG